MLSDYLFIFAFFHLAFIDGTEQAGDQDLIQNPDIKSSLEEYTQFLIESSDGNNEEKDRNREESRIAGEGCQNATKSWMESTDGSEFVQGEPGTEHAEAQLNPEQIKEPPGSTAGGQNDDGFRGDKQQKIMPKNKVGPVEEATKEQPKSRGPRFGEVHGHHLRNLIIHRILHGFDTDQPTPLDQNPQNSPEISTESERIDFFL